MLIERMMVIKLITLMILIETKGREDLDVAMKDEATKRWCENATNLTGKHWQYLKIGQIEFGKLKPENFGELIVGLGTL